MHVKTSGTLMAPSGMMTVVPPVYSACCDPPNLPWFSRMIDPPSTAEIEMCLCRDEAATSEDLSVELLELFMY